MDPMSFQSISNRKVFQSNSQVAFLEPFPAPLVVNDKIAFGCFARETSIGPIRLDG